ncbi:MAG: S8 family serine peptidase [Crocinitomicaceae bacterium]|nr:S8 family serine peptidase [Crocinitomicaceae bacterium]
MKKLLLLITSIGLTLVSSQTANAQEKQDLLLLKSGSYKLPLNTKSFIAEPGYESSELVNGHYYRILQFSEIPKSADKAELEDKGIKLFDYLPDMAFYASIDKDADLTVLSEKNVIAVSPIKREYKLIPELVEGKIADWALKPNNQVGINFTFFDDVQLATVQKDVQALGATITFDLFPQVMTIIIDIDQLETLYMLPYVYYFEFMDPPEEPEGWEDVSNHRSNYLHNPLGAGTPYTGDGVTIMMHDDGPIGPHIDYQGRTTTATSANYGDHGDHCAGIIMGAGNINQDAIGNAPGAHLYVYGSGNGNYTRVETLVDTANLVITSKSYGDGNNAGYTNLTRILDDQCWDYDQLVHVFSAGNSGTSNFGYGAGAGWGNITGGHKQGKNVLAVGNLSDRDVLNNSSSRGPAADGRIKPDICAVGTDVLSTIDVNTYDYKTGTSMACPAVAGSLALLYEAYRAMHDDQNPSAALINGAVLNTADDLGNPGPDFRFGWGRINVRRAYNLIEAENYQNGIIEEDQMNNHTINVPSNTKQLRVMVYWTDYRGTPSASKALVNDLNMTMSGPDGSSYLPLVLNPSPSPSLLDADAEPGIDDLNNVEQIVIDNPAAGNFAINIEGYNIPQGPQPYYIVYEVIQNDLAVTWPFGGESVTPGTVELVRWDAIGTSESFTVEYTIDDGVTWEEIGSSAAGHRRFQVWNVPDEIISGTCRIRVTRGSDVVEGQNFSIIGRPDDLDVEWACPNSFNFSWDPVDGAVAYEVYLLGEKYMDSAGYVTTTNATVYASSSEEQWVSVRAIGADGARGKRAIALRKAPGTSGCDLEDPIGNFIAECTQVGPNSCVQFTDLSINAGQGAAWEWFFPGGSPETSIYENPVVCYDTEGIYDVQLIVKNGVGEDTVFMSQYIQVTPSTALPIKEDFEATVLPMDWATSTSGVGYAGIVSNVSAYGKGSSSYFFDNFYSENGSVSMITTQHLDFTSETLYELQFDVAYAQRGTSSDSLKVFVQNGCGGTMQLIYSSGGNALSTADATDAVFVPTIDQWRNEHIPLSPYIGAQSLNIVFVNYSANGNNIYVDNINVLVSEENFEEIAITLFPNPVTDELNIAGMVEGEETTIRIYAADGKVIFENKFIAPGGTAVLNTGYLANGMYVIEIESASKSHKEKLIKGDI